MRKPLLEVIRERVLLGDGAMGTMLQAAGLAVGGCGEAWNVDEPEKVRDIQRQYIDAGSDLILTNTFQGCRITLGNHGEAERTPELNRAAARLAREVAGPDRYVIADVGPFGGMLEPLGEADPEEVREAFREQAAALLEEDVDALIIETQTALEELEEAIEGAKQALLAAKKRGAVALVASMAFDRKPSGPPKTMMGVDPTAAAEFMAEAGVDILGTNCGTDLDIRAFVDIVKAYRETAPDHPIMAQPNAGKPEREGGRVVYRETPEAMAGGVRALIDAGARIVGGCCGTTPEHIRRFRAEVDAANAR